MGRSNNNNKMSITNQDKINKILNHPNWNGDQNEAESLYVDLMLSFDKEKKNTKKRQVYKKVVMNADEMNHKWTAPHIKALLKKIDIEGVQYTKLKDTRESIISKMNDEIREAMKAVIEDIKKEESSGSYDVFAASKKKKASNTSTSNGGFEEHKESEPEGQRRTKLLEFDEINTDKSKVEKKKGPTLPELKNKAKELNIKNCSCMKKEELISIIKKVESAVDDAARLDLIKNVSNKNKMPNLKDLKAEAKTLKIKNFSKMKKAELELAIRNHKNEGNDDESSKIDSEIDENGTNATEVVDEIHDALENEIDENGTSVDDIANDNDEPEDFVNGSGSEDEEDYPDILTEDEYD